MKQLLLDLVIRTTPSRTVINNCMALIGREVVGLRKYGVALPDAGLTHEALLQHGREEALDLANYLEAAIETSRRGSLDHAELLGFIERQIQTIDRERADPQYHQFHPGLTRIREQLKTMLLEHETSRTIRGLRRS